MRAKPLMHLARLKRPKRLSKAFCLVLALCLVAAFANACKPSEELTEVTYSGYATNIDYDNPEKNYVQVPGATTVSEELDPNLEQDDANKKTVEVPVPVFGIPANSDEPVARVFYDEEALLERTAPIFALTSSDDRFEGEQKNVENPSTNNSDGDEKNRTSGNGAGGAATSSDDGKADSGADGNAGGDNNGNEEGTGGVGEETKRYNGSGGLLDPEDIRYVATVGEYANIALMLGGKGTLVATDDAFWGDEEAEAVLGEAFGLSDATVAWYYNAQNDEYMVDFNALLNALPHDWSAVVLVPDNYQFLTTDQEQALIENKVHVEPAPALSSNARIQQLVTWLGDSLSSGQGTVSGRNAAALASQYCSTYTGSDVESLISAHGGLTTYGGIDYSGEGHNALSSTDWCILATDFDAQATFDLGLSSNATGVAIATCGYGWSPVNYYLSVGGLNNNAAQFPVASLAGSSSADYYVWQLNIGSLPNYARALTYSKSVSDLGTYGNARLLVRAPASLDEDTAVSATLGASNFRYVLCADEGIAQSLKVARDVSILYQPLSWTSTSSQLISGFGYVKNNGAFVEGWIGNTNDSTNHTNLCETNGTYKIVTCGNGLYCDWVDGSAESFLMAFWTDGLTRGSWANFESEARSFYKTFYDYDLSDDELVELGSGRSEV